MVDIEDTYVTLLAAFSHDFANNVFCNQLFSILTYGIWKQINRYSFVLETNYSNSENCYSFQHYYLLGLCWRKVKSNWANIAIMVVALLDFTALENTY